MPRKKQRRCIDLRDMLNCYALEATKGRWALVSPEDIEKVRQWDWSVCSRAQYATRNLHMHHEILPRKKGYETDHINGNTLDNRRCNLRYATPSQNQANRRKQRNNTSGYKGVTWIKRTQEWRAQIMLNRKRHHLGYFETKEEAAQAYAQAAKKMFGKYARTD